MMMAFRASSPDEHRALSPELTSRLQTAIAEHWAAGAVAESNLSSALSAAATEARARGLRAEELLLVLKGIEQQVANALDLEDRIPRDRFRIWLIHSCLDAFFDLPPEGGERR